MLRIPNDLINGERPRPSLVEEERRTYLESTISVVEAATPEQAGEEKPDTGDFEIVVSLDGFEDEAPEEEEKKALEEEQKKAPEEEEKKEAKDKRWEPPPEESMEDIWAEVEAEASAAKEESLEEIQESLEEIFEEGEAEFTPVPHKPMERIWEEAEAEKTPVPKKPVEGVKEAEDRHELVMHLLRPLFNEASLSVLFLIRGEMATAEGASGSELQRSVVRSLVLPLKDSTLFEQALRFRQVVRDQVSNDPAQLKIAKWMKAPPPKEACVVPICPNDEPVNLLCVQSHTTFSDATEELLEQIGEAAEQTYVRLVRESAKHKAVTARSPTQEAAAVPAAPPPVPQDPDLYTQSGSISILEPISQPGTGSAGNLAISPTASPPASAKGTRSAKNLQILPKNQRKFGKYTLICRLASGGMANLYLAKLVGREGFEKYVAIKRIHEHLSEENLFIKMFVDEARLAARISHPNVAQVIELDHLDGSHFIAMEYVDGESLATLLRRARPKIPLCTRIVANAAAGLHAAHELCDKFGESLHVVHRDVSPHNILISYAGAVKVVDFGVARARGNLQTTDVGTVKGKFAYMSPEQIQSGSVDRRSDVFALGIVLYEATTYRRLFRTDTEHETILKVLSGQITPPSEIREGYPPALEKIVMKALNENPKKRYQTAEELQVALESFIAESGKPILPGTVAKLMSTVFEDNIAQKKKLLRDFEGEG
jgi:serine/threonine-protein kinase